MFFPRPKMPRKKEKTGPMSKYEAVFYDFDGTLADSIPVIMACFHMAYERVFGLCDRSDEDLMCYIGKPLESTFEMHGPELCKTLTDTYLDINEKMLREDAIDLFPGVMEDLLYLKSLGIRQGIMTSKREDSCMTTVRLKGMEEIFDAYVFKEDSRKHKPDAEPLIVAAEKIGTDDPSKILYVGDALPDLLCARNAGAGFALVDWSLMELGDEVNDPKIYKIKALRDISCIIREGEL